MMLCVGGPKDGKVVMDCGPKFIVLCGGPFATRHMYRKEMMATDKLGNPYFFIYVYDSVPLNGVQAAWDLFLTEKRGPDWRDVVDLHYPPEPRKKISTKQPDEGLQG